jgi:hypothetical protein
LTIVGLGITAGLGVSKAPADDKHDAPSEFAAKVLMVYCKDSSQNTVLGDVRERRLGGRAFLVGRLLSKNGEETAWNKATRWMLIDDVVSMYQFDNIEDARKAQSQSETAQDKQP